MGPLKTGRGIASIEWVEDVVRYAVSRIPRDKLLVGIPAYGFDWTEGKKYPRYLSYKLAMNAAERAGVSVSWDEKAKVPRYEYRDERGRHEVWFEDARSWQAKVDLVNEYDLAGIAIWRLGMEDPVGWEAIRTPNGFRYNQIRKGKSPQVRSRTTSLFDYPGPPTFARR